MQINRGKLPKGTAMNYSNPIIRGFNPDPSICRVGNDYYIVNSTNEYFPAIPVYHSTDLVNWEHIGNCIERPEQLDYLGVQASSGMMAPTIRYINDTFYVMSTFNGIGNFIVKSKNPATGWSDPVKINMGGIDPSILYEDGKAYYCTNYVADRKRGISLTEINIDTGEILSDMKMIWGGTDGGCIESPHIYHIGEYYYLLVAEGGTGFYHRVSAARSKNIYGPYESCPHNPVLTNREDTSLSVSCSGHADMFQDVDGNWWFVHIAVRNSLAWSSHIGRETFLTPVEWVDGWPMAANGKFARLRAEGPGNAVQKPVEKTVFSLDGKDPRFMYIRTPKEENFKFEGDKLTLTPSATNLADDFGQHTILLTRHYDMNCKFRATIDFDPANDGDESGVIIYLSPLFNYRVTKRRENGKNYIVTEKHLFDIEQIVYKEEVEDGVITFEIDAERRIYKFFYTVNGETREAATALTRFICCEMAARCFTGSLMGVYATSKTETTAKSIVSNIEAEGKIVEYPPRRS